LVGSRFNALMVEADATLLSREVSVNSVIAYHGSLVTDSRFLVSGAVSLIAGYWLWAILVSGAFLADAPGLYRPIESQVAWNRQRVTGDPLPIL